MLIGMKKKSPSSDPAPISPRVRWVAEAQQLRDDPGEWYLIDDKRWHEQLAYAIRSGTLKSFRPAGDFEAVAEYAGPHPDHPGLNRYETFARYVGE